MSTAKLPRVHRATATRARLTAQESAPQLWWGFGKTRSKTRWVTLSLFGSSALAMTDALAKLLIAMGIITDPEFKAQLSTERANYLAALKRMH